MNALGNRVEVRSYFGRRRSGSRATAVGLAFSLFLHLLLVVGVLFVRLRSPERDSEEAFWVLLAPPEDRERQRLPSLRRPLSTPAVERAYPVAEPSPQLVVTSWQPTPRTTLSVPLVMAPPSVSDPLPAQEALLTSIEGLRTVDGTGTGSRAGLGNGERTASRRPAGPRLRPSRLESVRQAVAVDPDLSLEIKTPLEAIAESLAAADRTSPMLDVVFLLDISQSMQDNIYAVARQLDRMAQRLQDQQLDLRIGIVTFHESTLNSLFSSNIEVTQPTADVEKIRRRLYRIKCSGGEKALNALMVAAEKVQFRPGASRHFVLVTDEYVDGDYTSREVFGVLRQKRIRVDVIGLDEPFQRALPARTGGIWIAIGNLSS
ncbi:MAG: hypothetical protein KatS3mg115_0048 [Candidatus Poribacteria bacterium]|nr:MAG: hypothetical protein KatS3mg115_0048 [Candidatus Poribacteria bacterium]